jgi:hypothetical protein
VESRGPHSGQPARPRRTGREHRVVLLARRRLLPRPRPTRRFSETSQPRRASTTGGYESAAKRFRIIFFSNNGPFTEEGNRYQGEVARAKLTFEGQARFQYELDDQGRIKLNPDGTVSVPWWLRDKNGAWTAWMNNTFTNIQD